MKLLHVLAIKNLRNDSRWQVMSTSTKSETSQLEPPGPVFEIIGLNSLDFEREITEHRLRRM